MSERIKKPIQLRFLKAYFGRYVEYERAGEVRTNRIDWHKTSQTIKREFGSKAKWYSEIERFEKFVIDNKIDSKKIMQYSINKVEELKLKETGLKGTLFINNDQASRKIQEGKENFKYDKNSAWSSELSGKIPVEAISLEHLTHKEQLGLFKQIYEKKETGYLLEFNGQIKEQTDNSIRTFLSNFILFDFELHHFLKHNRMDNFELKNIYVLTYREFPQLEKYYKRLYTKKEASVGIIEYNFWKSQMNYLNLLVFDKNKLIEAYVKAKIRHEVYRLMEHQTGVVSIHLDSIYSKNKLNIKTSKKMGEWKKEKKHRRNLAECSSIVKYDLSLGVFEDS
jgi:hypothetical protein